MARALLFQSGCPLKVWSECVLTTIFFINRTPSFVLNGKTLFELITGKQPNFSVFRSFGCLAYASVVHETDKFLPCAPECAFFRYA